MTADALREEAVQLLRRLGDKAAAAASRYQSNTSGHCENNAAARALVRAKDAARRPSLLYNNALEAAGVTADALQEEAVRALQRLGNKAAAAASRDHDDGSGHWDDDAAARALVRAKDATRQLLLLYNNAREAAGVTADVLWEEAVRALQRLDGEATAHNHGNCSGH